MANIEIEKIKFTFYVDISASVNYFSDYWNNALVFR